ncbi:MAG: cytochrome c [Anaerolineae bacterium]|jgi:hypothetical protein
MRSTNRLAPILKPVLGLALAATTLILAGCSLGEAVMPNPPTGVPADRSVGQVAPVPNPIPHTLEGRQDCFACHAIGAVDAPPVPPDHEQDVEMCITCHAVWRVPAIAAVAPPAIPHSVVDREDCLTCHKLGTGGAVRIPDNHDGLASDICQTCHTQMSEITGTSPDEGPAAEAPAIPHPLEGFDACSQCHEEGGPGIPQFPEDHQGRSDDVCTACHSPAAEATEAPEAAATSEPQAGADGGDATQGEALFATNCAPCHGDEGQGTGVAPEPIADPDLLSEYSDEELATLIREGLPGTMPAATRLNEQEIMDVVAFLRSW